MTRSTWYASTGAEAKGRDGIVLRAGERAVVTFAGYGQGDLKLKREADGASLGWGFEAAELATAGGGGGRLLHVAAATGRGAGVLAVLLAAHPPAAEVADAEGRLPLELAAAAGCSAEAWGVLWEGTGEEARLGWAAGRLGVAVLDPAAVAGAMTASGE